MRSPIAVGALATVLAATLAAGGPQVPGQATSFPAAVEEVLVDVVVADRDGTPVGGLTRDDFVLAEDGALQAVVSFEAVDVVSGAARDPLAPLPTVSANPAAGGRSPGRTFFLVYDDVRMTLAQGDSVPARPLGLPADEGGRRRQPPVRDDERLCLVGSAGGRRPRRRAGPDRWPEGPPRPGAPSRPDERRRGVPDRGPAGRRDLRARPAPLQEDGSGGNRAPAGGHGLPERDGVRPPEAPERHRRHGPRDRLRGGPRDPSAGRRPAAGHSRLSRARPRGPRRRARAQVRDPRLPRLLLRRRGSGVPAGGRGEPPGQRSRLPS